MRTAFCSLIMYIISNEGNPVPGLFLYSRDYVQIMQGWRVVRRLSGVYGRDDVDDDDGDDGDDGDCDDDDECDDDDKNGDGRLKRKEDSFQCVKRIYIRGTSEMITIIFKSDQYFTRRGFEAVYHVIPGKLKPIF